MFNIALCDDDNKFIGKLNTLLTDIFYKQDCKINVDMFYDGKALIQKVESNKKIYDIIFLDVDMPSMDGFKTAEKLRLIDKSFILLFTTNMRSDANKGYKYNAFRYILKETLEIDVSEALNIIINLQKELDMAERFIEFKCKIGNGFDRVNIREKDIIQLSKENRRVRLKTVHIEYELLTNTLAEYQKIIGSNHFIVVARSHLVNMAHIKDVKGDFFQLSNGETVCVGYTPEKKNEIKIMFAAYKNERI